MHTPPPHPAYKRENPSKIIRDLIIFLRQGKYNFDINAFFKAKGK